MKRYAWAFKWLGLCLAVLSITKLAEQGFHIGWAAPFRLVVDYYETMLNVLLGWSQPYLRSVLEYLNSAIGWHLHLFPHWKHVFVLMWLYFGAHVKRHWEETVEMIQEPAKTRYYRWKGEIGYSALATIWGGFVALISGVVCGTVPIEVVSKATQFNLVFVLVPVGAYLLYKFGYIVIFSNENKPLRHYRPRKGQPDPQKKLRRRDLWLQTRKPITVAVLILLIFVLWANFISLPSAAAIPSPNLALLLTIVLGISFCDLLYDLFLTRYLGRFWPEHSPRDRYFTGTSSPLLPAQPSPVVLQMLAALVGAALFVATNAGLKLIGL